ncbi:MAG: hypothetical protein ABW164_07250 [Sphingobium sp.]
MTSQDDERARRLAQALRDNLRRRKAQVRAATADAAPVDEPAPPPSDKD